MKINKVILVFTFLFSLFSIWGQNQFIGNFEIKNYTNEDFQSPVQFLTAERVNNGEYLFGNAVKIIHFDGLNWRYVYADTTKDIPKDYNKNKRVFEIFRTNNGEIYVAREESFGRVEYNQKGLLNYTPLFTDSSFTDIWGVFENDDGDLIITYENKILKFNPETNERNYINVPESISDGKIYTAFDTPKGIILSISYKTEESVKKHGVGAYILYNEEKNEFKQLNVQVKSENVPNIRGYFKTEEGEFVIIEGNGIFNLIAKNNSYKIDYKKKNVYQNKLIPNNIRTAIVKNEKLWIGTEDSGLYIYDLKGNFINKFNNNDGLQDNCVYKILIDPQENAILALDNGISIVKLSTPTSFWNKNHGVIGAIESLEFIDSTMLLSSRTGGVLNSYIEDNKLKFKKNDQINEASFDLEISKNKFDTSILVVGYTGIWELNRSLDFAERIIDAYAWKLLYSEETPDKIYVGGEGFLSYMEISNGTWKHNTIIDTEDDVRSLTKNDDYIYFGVRGNGLHRWKLYEEPEKLDFNENVKIKDAGNYNLEVFNGEVYAGSNGGLLKIDGSEINYANIVNREFNYENVNIHRIFAHPKKDELWAVIFIDKRESEEKEIGYFTPSEEGLKWNKINSPMIEKGVIYEIKFHNDLLYFTTTEGVFSFDNGKYEALNEPWDIRISSIEIGDSLAIGNTFQSQNSLVFDYGKPVRFNFIPSSFYETNEIAYRTRIKGYTDEWSSYEKIPFKDFEKLPHGTYTIEVQAKNLYGSESNIYKYNFSINPPWYFSIYAIIVYIILLIAIIFISSKIAIYRVKQKNKLLEETVKERTKEISSKNSLLENQKKEIELKNEDIMDSIKYAKRIQDTILPSEERMNKLLGENFVFFRPKDIVSGDFYWAKKIRNKVYWSAIDCTGHGVPGALVSFVGNNGLQRAINEFELRKPSDILDKLRELVIDAFKNQGENDVKDGMDMALVCYDKKDKKISFSGAHNSLVIIRNEELIEIKADKQPIGYFSSPKQFTNHEIEAREGDCIYVYSDGFVDQFGGDTEEAREKGGKKYKSKKFKRLLVEIHKKPMKEQREIIINEFNNWKGDLDQLDDVCVIGVRL